MSEIAQKAGYGRATLYRHFQSKEDIIKFYFEKNNAIFQDLKSITIRSKDDFYEVIFRVFSALKDNKEIVFKNLEAVADLTEEEKEGLTDEQLQQAYKDKIDDRIDHADTETNFKLLSEGYNSADFSIGTNFDYFIFEITATAG